ncbi:MAG: DegT/DnrJ/EryC1/StrS family aminotransferase [Rhodospirillales bacterium]
MVVTNDDGLAEDMRAHRDWGQKVKHDHSLIGFNYRMDGVQGAALGVKIKYLAQWSKARQTWAALYDNLLSEAGFEVLPRRDDVEHVHHVYGILHPDRDSLQAALQAKGIGTNIHYPVPLHKQTVYADLGQAGKSCPVAERVGAEELSLPMFAELGESAVRQVVAELVASAET